MPSEHSRQDLLRKEKTVATLYELLEHAQVVLQETGRYSPSLLIQTPEREKPIPVPLGGIPDESEECLLFAFQMGREFGRRYSSISSIQQIWYLCQAGMAAFDIQEGESPELLQTANVLHLVSLNLQEIQEKDGVEKQESWLATIHRDGFEIGKLSIHTGPFDEGAFRFPTLFHAGFLSRGFTQEQLVTINDEAKNRKPGELLSIPFYDPAELFRPSLKQHMPFSFSLEENHKLND